MNRIILVVFFCISTLSLMSQNISDALNYTNNNIDGSARFSAMGGAFGALGGEISSISLNPAGSAIFNNSYFSLSFASDKKTNDVNLLKAGHHIGIDTIGQSLRNANLQLRSEPANPQVNVGPWNNTTMEADNMRVPLEIGQGPQ